MPKRNPDGKETGEKYFEELKKGMRVIADVESLPLQDSSTDVVILLESSFIEEPRYIKELTRVLKKGGMLLLSRDFMFYEDDEERKPKRRELMNISGEC